MNFDFKCLQICWESQFETIHTVAIGKIFLRQNRKLFLPKFKFWLKNSFFLQNSSFDSRSPMEILMKIWTNLCFKNCEIRDVRERNHLTLEVKHFKVQENVMRVQNMGLKLRQETLIRSFNYDTAKGFAEEKCQHKGVPTMFTSNQAPAFFKDFYQ